MHLDGEEFGEYKGDKRKVAEQSWHIRYQQKNQGSQCMYIIYCLMRYICVYIQLQSDVDTV